MFELFLKGGALMYAILLCSVIALAVIIERWIYLRRIKVDMPALMGRIYEDLKRDKILDVVTMCDQLGTPLAEVLKAGILKHDHEKEKMKEAIEDASLHEIPKLERNLGIIATVAHVSPLLGLLGTVQGMIQCFRTIEVKAVSGVGVNPGDLAGGIWVALLTTAFGLVVAIPAYVAHDYLVTRVNEYITEMEQSSTSLVTALVSRREIHEV